MHQAFVFLTALASAALAAVPLYGQCGGSGWAGETTCTTGICSIQNEWYSQCIPGQATNPPASTVSSTSTAPNPVETTLPSSFTWSSSGILISPRVDSRNLSAWKDPSIVFYNGKYHVFASTAHDAGYNLVYLSFTDFNEADAAPFYYLDQTPIGSGYRAAPQVFLMAPQNKWYLIFQNGNAAYSTNSDISNPNGWTPPKNFYSGTPSIITNNIGSGFWVDMWVICDSSNCHLFSSDDNGHLYRSQTSVSNFPAGMSEPVIALQDSNSHNLFEASNVYKVGDGFLLVVECIGSNGHRYFRSWSGASLSGSWTPLAASQTNPFAGSANVAFSGTPWTMDISHGEVVRTNVDQTMSISACGMRYLYQGVSPTASGSYNSLPWRLALLTQTSPC
ncbi:glycoside hydrolase family 62 protein [Pleurotus ostreatus PC15]|uniref:Alpha-L-arabinofuranosidase n=1 Tax=Pleurotus ostreatus (strain PC15) TaxID=1137138 RepID=A0A067P312_PLEO1|nr:glycoside hydrolase family 62 protein [Pleurotus ostreatus PC15]